MTKYVCFKCYQTTGDFCEPHKRAVENGVVFENQEEVDKDTVLDLSDDQMSFTF